jgi:hypothetical protein
MRRESSITPLSWMPSEAVEGSARAHLDGGRRTSTVVAVTPCRVTSAQADQLDRAASKELPKGRRREKAVRG